MKDQINTIRAALEPLTNNSGVRKALTALSELEAMAGSQEPVGYQLSDGRSGAPWHFGLKTKFAADEHIAVGGAARALYAAPVAQQPQQVKALRAPTKTEWGADMVCIYIELDKDTTATVFFDRDDTTKVEQRFGVEVQHV